MAVEYFDSFGINKGVNSMVIYSQWLNLIFNIGTILIIFFNLTKELFNRLVDWIFDKEPNYPSFGECKLWIKRQNPQYIISKNDQKDILMLLTYLPMSQRMNNVLYSKYLDQIFSK